MASPSYKVEVAVKNACSKLGEGPHWDGVSQTLIFVDIEGKEVHRWHPETDRHEVKKMNGRVGHVVPRAKGGYVLGLERRLVGIQWDAEDPDQKTDDLEQGDKTFRFNDGKCDAKGRLWGGTLSSTWQDSDSVFKEKAGSLYRLDAHWTVSKQHSGLTISNGLAWTADNSVMFLVDSGPKQLYAFNFDLEAGTLSNQRTVVTLPADTGLGDVNPDGMTIDTEGKLWIACWNGRVVIQIDPETGKMLRKIEVPALQPSSVSWGGPNLDELYVTSARMCSQSELDTCPLNGSIFKVTGLGTRGYPAFNFQG